MTNLNDIKKITIITLLLNKYNNENKGFIPDYVIFDLATNYNFDINEIRKIRDIVQEINIT